MEIHIAKRMKALLIDYLVIVIYLILLFLLASGFFFTLFGKIPEFTELQAQLISFFTSVLPVTLFNVYRESGPHSSSIGKSVVGLKVEFAGSHLTGSVIRNIVKFLPWQIAHFSVIKGIYSDFNSPALLVFLSLSLLLPVIFILMVWLRKDHRHLGDLFANSYVVPTQKT